MRRMDGKMHTKRQSNENGTPIQKDQHLLIVTKQIQNKSPNIGVIRFLTLQG